jgi:hypothetical protein
MNIEKIKNDGFFIRDTHPRVKNMAFMSLSMALKAYFSTYKSMSFRFSYLKNSTSNSGDFFSPRYNENACEAIFHLQHFLELYIKEILEEEHILLAIDVNKKPSLLYDILKNNKYDETILEKERQLEFREALTRLVSLIKDDKIPREKYDFIVKANKWLLEVNYLRNRIAHRGVFVLRYRALDFLFGKYVFPFLKRLLSFEGNENRFFYLKVKTKKDVNLIDELIYHFEKERYDICKVALLKELGRACFENPSKHSLREGSYAFALGRNERERAELIAYEVSKTESIGETFECPVCKAKSLVKYLEYVETFDQETNEFCWGNSICTQCNLLLLHI